MNRRGFIAVAALAPLAGCVAGAPTLAGLSADVETIASGLKAILPDMLPLIGNAAKMAQVQGYVTAASNAAAAVAGAVTAAAAAPLVSQIISAVQALAGVVLPLAGLSAGTVAVIQAALSLLPTLAAAVGLSLGDASAPVYTPDAARLLLHGAALGG